MSARGRPRRVDVYARFEGAATDLTRLGGLSSPVEAAGIWDDIWHLEAQNSTAIEGNTLILREVEVLLDTGRAVGAKELRDYLEVAGYGQAARWVYTQALTADGWQSGDLITVTEIRHIHTLAMGPVWELSPHPDADLTETPGSLRRHDIHPFGAGMTPPAWTDVPNQLQSWVRDVAALAPTDRSDPVPARDVPLTLARLHCTFERIHPFIDGNGRVGRLTLKLIPVQLGWPPSIIYKRARDRTSPPWTAPTTPTTPTTVPSPN